MTKNDCTISVILAAAGSSSRMKSEEFVSKQFMPFSGKPLLFYSLEKICLLKDVVEIIVVTNDVNATKELIGKNEYLPEVKLVLGGKLRQDSVYSGFCEVSPYVDLVLIHDVARPFFDIKDTISCIERAKDSGTCVLAFPVVDTLKKVKSHQDKLYVECTLPREGLYEVQTPQVFAYGILKQAYEKCRNSLESNSSISIFTDESSMVELLGIKVSLIVGSRKNFKVTYPEDLQIASVLI